jgi:glutathione S-transferase
MENPQKAAHANCVSESRAIAQYIATKYQGKGAVLFPSEADLKAYALYQQVCTDWLINLFGFTWYSQR